MLSLNELQREFIKGLRSESNEILKMICSNQLSSHDHLEIYRKSVMGSFQKVLKEIYPVCLKLVGEEFFIAMINIYIEKTVSTSTDIGNVGRNFSDFVANFAPSESLPYLSDVAKLEWAMHSIFSAPDSPRFDFEKLHRCIQTSEGEIIFILPSGSHLLSSSYPVHRIWEMNQENYTGDQTITLEQNMVYYFLVWKDNLHMRIDQLTRYNWIVVNCFHQNKSLNEICSELSQEVDVVEVLPDMVKKGWLVDFRKKME